MKNIVHIETISEIHAALGLDKPRHPLISIMHIDDNIRNYEYGDTTYTFGFYQVALKSGMFGSILYGRNSYDFQEGSMVFTKPGQAMTFSVNADQAQGKGWVLFFHPDLIRRSALDRVIDQYTYFSYEVNEALHVSAEEQKSLVEILEKIQSEYNHAIDRHSQKLIVSNIELLLDYCTRYYDRQFYVRTNLNQDVVTRFESMLIEYFNSDQPLEQGIPSVKDCSDKMNMSAAYLSDMLKKETGRSAKQHIQDALIERAKTMLLGTNEQVSQIAYALGFEYPQHFSKLFKTKTGSSPAQFRALH